MSAKPKIHKFTSLKRLATHLRDDLNGGGLDFVLLYAYNGTGKTRLSMEFKDSGKRKNRGQPDTLYFNAFTEALFSWDNDLNDDKERRLHINTDSKFFKGLKDLALDERIGPAGAGLESPRPGRNRADERAGAAAAQTHAGARNFGVECV